MEVAAERVYDALGERLGESLRVVSYFEGNDMGVVHMREDVRGRYSEADDRTILRHARDESHTASFREFDFEADLRAVTRLFDEMLVNYIFLEPGVGIIVSLEPDGQYTYPAIVTEVEDIIRARDEER